MTNLMDIREPIIDYDDVILITGANGFIGAKVVEKLVSFGFTNLRCFMRSVSISGQLKKTIEASHSTSLVIVRGNLLSPVDCERAVEGVKVIYHLAASTQERSFSDAYKNSVDSSRNLLEAALKVTKLKRLVNVSSFSVYSNMKLRPGALLDESCPIET
jgi:nucleoside-diphosphate-sugar epimerase